MHSQSLQFFPQHTHRAEHARSRHARRDAQSLRDVRVGFFFNQPKLRYHAQSWRQLRKYFAKSKARLLLYNRIWLPLSGKVGR